MTRSAAVALVLAVWHGAPASAQTGGNGRIAYLSVSDGKPGIFVMDGDGSGRVRLTTGNDMFHSWSRDGCRLTFRRDIAKVHVVEADGTRERLVVETAGDDPSGDLRSSFSPDGSRLVFSARMRGATGKDLFTVTAGGSDLKRLTGQDGTGISHYLPQWSPDGMRILFTSNGGRGLSVMNADGSGTRKIPDAMDGAWLPGGSAILAFVRDGLQVIDLDGRAPAAPPSGKPDATGDFVVHTSVSPDGSRIAFIGMSKDDKIAVKVMDRDGSNVRALADLVRDDVALYMAGPSAMPPAWSPDGRRIAFARLSGVRVDSTGPARVPVPSVDIFSVGADGTGLKQLTRDGVSSAPAWAPLCAPHASHAPRPGKRGTPFASRGERSRGGKRA